MSALLILVCCATAVLGQADYLRDSQNAAILKDSRYLSGDGTFGAAYSQEDGVEFKEESDEYGNRRGSYSYVDPEGRRRTVHYTAGVNGFQASGDHIPSQPPPTPPQPEYVPLARYNPPDYVPPQHLQARAAPPRPPRYQLVRRPYEPAYETHEPQYEPEPPQPARVAPVQPLRYNPPARPAAPRYNRPAAQPQLVQYQHSSYATDYPGSGSLRYDTKYEPEGQYHRAVAPVIAAVPTAPPARYLYNELTTPSPRRFYPPGKLDFNRTPDGFSYTFSKS